MKQIVEFPLEDGDFILIEVDAPPQPVDDRIGVTDDVIRKANKSFDSAMEKIKPVANTIIEKVRSMNQPADEIEVKFGIKLSAEMGAVIASGEAEVNYEITLKWHHK
ncbi:CU044_2847 family protein [Okeania sp.]|uniref:CU044_2847 family protein n=1 Tax=Okeania sp. TaxID=3100323 RepID=UPI002B4B6D39|nr:CU044_2847 family protein [Okeania sp.]MEB3340181.1 CU044_2847 family protein [Okeania sp.]